MGRSGGGGSSGGKISGGFSGGGRVSGGFSGGSGGRSGGSGGSGGRSGDPHMGDYSGGHSDGGSFLDGFLVGTLLGDDRSSGDESGGGSYNEPINPNNSNGSNESQDPNTSNQNANSDNNKNSGCGTAFIVAAIIVIALIIGVAITDGCSSDAGVSASTIERTPLPAGAVKETPYFTDEDGDWIHNSQALVQGMRHFYEETGVQPYLYILPNEYSTSISQLTNISDQLYDELFTDQGHFLLVFCDSGNSSYNFGYTIGEQAVRVMDSEAINIFNEFLSKNYDDRSLSEEQIFANTYEETAERIMQVTPPLQATSSSVIPVVVLIIVTVVLIIVVVVIRKRAEERARKEAHTREILNTPLEKFSDSNLEELEKKYSSEDAKEDGKEDNPAGS